MAARRRPRVLLVDDEPALLRALTRELDDFADVTTARTVTDALDLCAQNAYDVVVADLRLPDRWGDELLAHVAAYSPGTRRVLFTADRDPQHTVRELIDRGVIENWYRKPWTEELIGLIRGCD